MQYKSGHELLSEIRKIMYVRHIQIKELAILMNRSQQSVSQIFKTGNPKYNTLVELCEALDIEMSINLKHKDDTK